MIKLRNLISELIAEQLTYRELMNRSDPARIDRASRIPSKSLFVKSLNDREAWKFSYKTPHDENTTGLRHQGFIYFMKEDMDKNKSAMDINCSVDCSCFEGTAKVLMEDGTYKCIKDIVVGDKVFTHNGRVRSVTKVMVRPTKNDESVYKMKLIGFPYDFIVTGEHPFYTLRGNDYCRCGCKNTLWIQSEDNIKLRWSPEYILRRNFLTGHHMKNIGNHLKDKSQGVFEWLPVNDLKPREWFLSPWFVEGTKLVDPGFARLIGYYASEGCLPNERGSAVRLTFNINEWDTLGSDVMSICKKLNLKAHRKQANGYNCFNVTILNNEFKQYCKLNVGQGSHTKKLSTEIMSWDNESLKNLFIGAILGDGWLDPKQSMKLFSVDFDLISQYFVILNKLKIRNMISFGKLKSKTTNGIFQISVCRGESSEIVREWLMPYLREKDKFLPNLGKTHDIGYYRNEGHLHGIRSIEKINYTGLVYNIAVEEDESYIVAGVAVHNCPDYRYRFSYANKVWGSGENGPRSLNKGYNYSSSINEGPGLCKHLLALKEFLKTKIEKTAPTPQDPTGKNVVIPKTPSPDKEVPEEPEEPEKIEKPEDQAVDTTQSPDIKPSKKVLPKAKKPVEDPTQAPEKPETEEPEKPEEKPVKTKPKIAKLTPKPKLQEDFNVSNIMEILDSICEENPEFVI